MNSVFPTTIKILDFEFSGPHLNTGALQEMSGVYVILTRNPMLESSWFVIDVGESGTLRSRIERHDRAPEWNRSSRGQLGVAALYTTGWDYSDRLTLERLIRRQFQPPCGDR